MKMNRRVLSLLCALALSPLSAFSASTDPLKVAEGKAKEIVQASKDASLKRHKSLKRLRKDLHYISEELDREILGPKKSLADYSKGGLMRIARLRADGNIDPKLEPTLEKLEKIYTDLPNKDYAKEYPRGLVKALSHELRWIADEAADEAELLKMLDENLTLPDEAPAGSGGPIEAEAWFPTDVSLAKFKKLGPIRIFLVKHRIKRPKSHVVTTPEDIHAERHNVQIGAEITGKVTAQNSYIDGDYTFDIGPVHLEITPEWRITHPKMHKPKVGDTVRVKGWTYFDIFHKAEEEYDPADPTIGLMRISQWEIHPVQEIELLP